MQFVIKLIVTMLTLLLVFYVALEGRSTASQEECTLDSNCAFYPNELKLCKDTKKNCQLLRSWCFLFDDKLKAECPNTCNSCGNTKSCHCGEWTLWTECNQPCGGGEMFRRRECDRSNDCEFVSSQARTCNTLSCSEWSSCSRSCGGGSRWKYFACGSNNRFDCQRLYQDCNEMDCPSRPCKRTQVHRYNVSSNCCDTAATSCGQFKISSNIIGGVNVKQNEFPWTLLLEIVSSSTGNLFYCGAVLINSLWALTAAHCLWDTSEDRVLIIAGIRHTGQRGQRVRAQKIVIHPLFNMPYGDIAVIKFSRPLELNRFSQYGVSPICLPRGEETPIDANCYAAGWGATNRYVHQLSATLQVVKLRNLPLHSCLTAYRNESWGQMIDRSMVCAGAHSGEKDSCAGDSGGPLMCQRCSSCAWYLAGITSFGPTPCATPGYPGVYTKVLEHELWIDDEVKSVFEEGLWDHDSSCP